MCTTRVEVRQDARTRQRGEQPIIAWLGLHADPLQHLLDLVAMPGPRKDRLAGTVEVSDPGSTPPTPANGVDTRSCRR
jgi:hypothetical protein